MTERYAMNNDISEKALISVVVPVHNVENYIEKCINSILQQDYDNLEILLIDDGSTDRSGLICDNYSVDYENVITIHKANEGLSSARNVGVEKSSGDYILFIDSDDYIENGYIRYLYNLLIVRDADMSVCDLCIVREGAADILPITKEVVKEFAAKEAIEDALYQRHMDVSACAKLYKKRLFHNVEFPIGQNYEDLATTYKLFDACRKVVYGNGKRYFYVKREGSITRGSFSDKSFEVYLAFDEMRKDVLEKYLDLEKACVRRWGIISAHFIARSIECGFEDDRIKCIRKRLKRLYFKILFDPHTLLKDKIKIFVILYFPDIYVKRIK